jgi:hypothetical protein
MLPRGRGNDMNDPVDVPIIRAGASRARRQRALRTTIYTPAGYCLASQRQGEAKLLHKALDRRYRVSINQFAKAKTAEQGARSLCSVVKFPAPTGRR